MEEEKKKRKKFKRNNLICINSNMVRFGVKVVPLLTEIIIPYTYKYYRGDAPNWF